MKKIFTALLLALYMISLAACSGKSVQEVLRLNREESCYSDFEVREGKATVFCYLTVENTGRADLSFMVSGDFSEDRTAGLLTESVLFACNLIGEKRVFSIEAGGTKTIECAFQGDFGGTMQKKNRLLPENILFYIIDQ